MTSIPRNNLSLYDDVAAQWWSDDVRWIRTLKNMVPGRLNYFDQFCDWNNKKVLDLGCAGGFMAESLEDRGAIVTGIDPAAQAIEAAKAHAIDRKITYDVGAGEHLPYDNGAFDIVVSVDVLEHVQNLEQVVSEVVRVLKPGGLFCFDTINRNPLASFVAVTVAENVLKILPEGTHDPAMFIKPTELRSHFVDAGLTPGKFTGLGPRGLNRKGDFTFGRLPLTGVIYMGTAVKA